MIQKIKNYFKNQKGEIDPLIILFFVFFYSVLFLDEKHQKSRLRKQKLKIFPKALNLS